MFQPMLYGLGTYELFSFFFVTFSLFYKEVKVLWCTVSNIKLWFVSLDQSMLDDIEKSINDNMKRILSWLQQLK